MLNLLIEQISFFKIKDLTYFDNIITNYQYNFLRIFLDLKLKI